MEEKDSVVVHQYILKMKWIKEGRERMIVMHVIFLMV